MKRGAAFFAVLTLLSFAAAAANAQVGMPDGTHSCFQVPPSPVTTSAPVATFGSFGWDLFLSGHANRLILALSQWHPSPGHAVVPTRVRVAYVGNRATR
jgi:hypothetical protein